jgi:hypothetical protein
MCPRTMSIIAPGGDHVFQTRRAKQDGADRPDNMLGARGEREFGSQLRCTMGKE